MKEKIEKITKENLKKIEKKVVKEALKSEKPHVMLYRLLYDAVCIEDYPDGVEVRTTFATLPHIVVFKKNFKRPLPKGLIGEYHFEDAITVEEGTIIGLNKGLVEVALSKNLEKYKKKKYKFILLSGPEQDLLMSFLDKYINYVEEHYNANSTSLFASIIPLSMKDNSPDEEWNKRVKEEQEKREREEREKVKKSIRIMIEDLEELSKERYKGLTYSFTGKGVRINYLGKSYKLEIEETDWRWEAEVRGVIDFLSEVKEEYEKKKLIEEVKNGKKPLFILDCIDKKGGKYEVYLKNGIAEIPENIMGHFIGKKGVRIKAMVEAVGMFKVRKTAPIKIENEYPAPLCITESGEYKLVKQEI